jgi:hypothetical protein
MVFDSGGEKMIETSINYLKTNQIYSDNSGKDGVKLTEQSTQNPTEYFEKNKTSGEFSNLMLKKKEEILERYQNGEEESTFQTGASSMTQLEWKRLIGKVDNAIEQIKKEQKIKEKQQIKKEQKAKKELKTREQKDVKKEQKEKEIKKEQREEEVREEKEEKKKLEEAEVVTESMVLELLKDRDSNNEKA